uniref:SET domain-containing protein n=1 Tax=Trypanosoma congolense (strain IL3000) TaxID=1068625 RepID=G0UVC4_TRYCI|nr:conserved hypothetical protein [Trypanosoma congolense IL3000]
MELLRKETWQCHAKFVGISISLKRVSTVILFFILPNTIPPFPRHRQQTDGRCSRLVCMSLTRLGPSKVVPGATGVFLTRSLKKFTPVEVSPAAGSAAPPYLCNLLHAPRKTISLRRFLALRHQFSTGMYFNIATARGWYLLVPSTYAPLSDPAGLKTWMERHHHRYPGTESIKDCKSRRADTPSTTCSVGESLSSPLGGVSGILDASYGKSTLDSRVMEGLANDRVVASMRHSGSKECMLPPVTIQEDHLFEINDGVLWETPPCNDLAQPTYWKGHKERMQVYEDIEFGADQADDIEDGGLQDADTWMLSHDQDTLRQRLARALTFKANVRLSVEDDTHLLLLTPIMDLNEGEELLLHYGREWWSQRLLARLFTAVTDDDMHNIRWIESLFSKPTDVTKPFPLLTPAVPRGKGRNILVSRRGQEAEPRIKCEGPTKAILYNVTTRRRATDAEAIAFAVRRSCVDKCFFSLLVGTDNRGVFNYSRCDEEVSVSRVRRALLQSLRHCEGRANSPLVHGAGGNDESESDSEQSFVV